MLAVAGGLVLWLLRLCLAPASTLAGFRTWVLEECPVAPGRRAPGAFPAASLLGPPPEVPTIAQQGSTASRDGTKTARFLALVI
jgi:hypothetical protein